MTDLSEEEFLEAIGDRLLTVDPTMGAATAQQYAATILDCYLSEEEIAFGDPEYSWDEAAAHAVTNEEISCWEGG